MQIILVSFILSLSSLEEKECPSFISPNENISSPVKITYLTRSGWLAETKNHLLLFDYVPYDGKNFDDFVKSQFDSAVKNNKKLFIFISHEHEDHFYPKLLDWSKKYINLKLVLGWNNESSQTGIYKLSGRDEHIIDAVKVAVHEANDAGAGFLVTVDGITIYHSGDHAQWLPELKEDFLKEIKYIKDKTQKIDIALVPVENRRQLVMNGAVAATKVLNPEYVFPMHSKFEDYKTFADRVKTELPSIKVHYPKMNKDLFRISK
jgi:L-ascorbate metabolism protein UlaG (beta-lactamase superfamily)